MESVTNRTKCSQGKVGWQNSSSLLSQLVSYMSPSMTFQVIREVSVHQVQIILLEVCKLTLFFFVRDHFEIPTLILSGVCLWSAYVKETNCKYYLYPTGNMSQPSRILPQSNETLLKSYTKRLKDDVKSILDNFTEIVKSSKVYTKPKFKCLHVYYLLH